MATSREMTAGPALPLIFNFTMPLLLGNLLQQTYSLVDAAIVGKFLGINALAAVGASSSVIFLILGFCNGCSCGFGIPVAQKFGARDYVMMRRYVAVSLQLSLVMSVMIALITSIYCADILRIMRTPENIFEGAYAYLLVTFIGVPCTFLYNLLSSIIRALGDSKTPFWFLLFSTILNIILDLFCILVLKWGVLGAAIATVFSQGISALLCYVYMYRHFQILKGEAKDTTELEILKNTELFLHVSAYFFPFLGLLCILRYTIQGAGYTNLAMLSGVSEMIARTLVSIYAVPVYGYIAVCFGDPTAWLAADLFLIPAFIYVYRKLKELRCPLTEG